MSMAEMNLSNTRKDGVKIGIIGCGHMGGALLKGIIAKGAIGRRNILVSDQDRKKLKFAQLRHKVKVTALNSEVAKSCTVVILAVKPEDLDTVLKDLNLALDGKLLISICAGISTKRLEQRLGKISVVRVMPNMPAQIGQGISAISLGKYATAKNRKVAESIFSCVGEVVEVKEQWMDAVTAISGSGPAYFFHLAETLIISGQQFGLPRRIAQSLAIKTALGSAILMNQSALSPEDLRRQVASKGGTTEAAFNLFKKKGLQGILRRGFSAAARRSKELSK